MGLLKAHKKIIITISLVFSSLIFTNQAVFASSITVTTNLNPMSVSVAPGQFGSASQTITVTTDNLSGYKVRLSTIGPSSALVHDSDNTKTIPTFTLPSGSTDIPFSSLTDGYGFSVDNGSNFFPAPEPNAPPVEIFSASSAGTNNHVLTVGVLNPTSTAAGTYSNTFTVMVVANLDACTAGKICYYGNDDDGKGTMPDQNAPAGTSTALLSPNFSRPGYGFVGWNTEMDGTGTNLGPNEQITPSDYGASSSVGLQLYAKWVQSSGYLQTWSGCSTLNEGEVIALTDSRDGNAYAVTKHPDGHCWMMENLRLDLSDTDLTITEQNTNKPTATFESAVNTNHPASSNGFCTSTSAQCLNTIYYNTNNTNRQLTASHNTNNNNSSWYSYGHYYNWYTITAGNGTSSTSTMGAQVDGDICPYNWRLPTGYGTSGDLANLDAHMPNGTGNDDSTAAGSARWRTWPYNFIYSGEQRSAGYNRGTSSSYATMNAKDAGNTANLWLKTDGVKFVTNGTAKWRGQTARCMYMEDYHVRGDIHYDANGGTGTMTDEIDVSFATAVAANNGFTKAHSTFKNWNTEADGSGVVVMEAGSVMAAAQAKNINEGETLTLYAIWESIFDLVYDGNGADDGSMTSVSVNDLQQGARTLVASNYSRAGYGFAGWSLDSTAASKLASGQPVKIYGPNEKITVDNAFYNNADQNNQITLYAVWTPEDTTYTMQTFGATECSNMSVGDVLALKDARDNNTYMVAKHADNNCWMAENLRLDPKTVGFDTNNTNQPTQAFVTRAPNTNSSNTLCNTDDSTCNDEVHYNTNNINRDFPAAHNNNQVNKSWYSYGVMYNWYTATAGNGTFALGSGEAAGDICPYGWRLPTGGASGETVTLNTMENNGSGATDAGLVKFPVNFVYSGDYNYQSPGGRNSYGRWWTSTPVVDANTWKAYRLGTVATGATPAGSWNKWDGFAVRCIVKPSSN